GQVAYRYQRASINLLVLRFCLRLVGIPVFEMTVLARLIDRVTGLQQRVLIFGIDSVQSDQHAVMQSMRRLVEGFFVLVDELFHLLRLQLDSRILRFFMSFGDMPSRYQKKVGALEQSDDITPRRLPFLVGVRKLLVHSRGIV